MPSVMSAASSATSASSASHAHPRHPQPSHEAANRGASTFEALLAPVADQPPATRPEPAPRANRNSERADRAADAEPAQRSGDSAPSSAKPADDSATDEKAQADNPDATAEAAAKEGDPGAKPEDMAELVVLPIVQPPLPQQPVVAVLAPTAAPAVTPETTSDGVDIDIEAVTATTGAPAASGAVAANPSDEAKAGQPAAAAIALAEAEQADVTDANAEVEPAKAEQFTPQAKSDDGTEGVKAEAADRASPAPTEAQVAHAGPSEPKPAASADSAAIGRPADMPPPVPASTAPVNQAAPSTNIAQPAPASAATSVPVAGLAVEIAARAQAGSHRFDIRLDPPELGRIDVRLDVDRQGNVTSHLVVERAQTLDLLRRDAPQLQQALQDAGLKGGDLQFSLRDQGFGAQQQNDRNEPAAANNRVVIPEDDLPPVETARGYGRLFGRPGGIDIRV